MHILKKLNEIFVLETQEPPATKEAIQELKNFSSIDVPFDYLEVIQHSTNAEFNVNNEIYIRIWGPADCIEINEAHNIQKYIPNSLAIGANIKTDAMKMDISIPMLMDEGKKALYVKANNVKSLLQLAGIPGDSFSTLEGKVIKMDMKDLGEVDTKESTKIQEKVQKSLLDAIKALPEDNFTKEKDVYTVKLTGKDLKAVIEKVFDEMSTMKNFTGTKQEIADFKKELEGANLGKSSVSLIYTMDGKIIKKQDAAIHFEAKNPKDEKETFKFDMNIHSDIKSIDKPIKFTFDTSEKNIVPMDELQKMIGEFMNQFMMNGEMDGGKVTPFQPAPTEPAT